MAEIRFPRGVTICLPDGLALADITTLSDDLPRVTVYAMSWGFETPPVESKSSESNAEHS